ncbi:thioredoxin-interacting protein isoform X1 [Strigops habroptila]|uniref:thioredoxin-interacting protein isoform X1 n=1 Tax=Strigops habroptila TaxID=2489341 RepID=UPI0011CFD104|nr:thioredoxin-interacting protein isoform X1 [Strigops habroptila]
MVMFKKVKTFVMTFSEPEKVYSSGEKVVGRILVEVAEVTRVNAVKVLACGVARVNWTKGPQQCRQEMEYLRFEDVLTLEEQPTDGDGSVILRPGNKYEYKFGFELPQGPLGTTFKGKYGCVDYWVKAFLERPSFPTQEIKKRFEVMDPVDVNTPELLSPVAAKKEKKVSCMFIPDGRVSVSAQIDRKGFCEGDDICINADFENTCSRIVVPKAAIMAKHTYLANGQTKVFTQKLSCVRGNHIISGMSESWRGKTIRVKKLKPSILGCNILRVEYFLQIYVSVPGSKKIILELPLVIGSRSGIGSRSSSMASQASSEMSWVDLNLPDAPEAPPCYLDIVPEDHRLESPTTPLLDDTDSFDSPIFMWIPASPTTTCSEWRVTLPAFPGLRSQRPAPGTGPGGGAAVSFRAWVFPRDLALPPESCGKTNPGLPRCFPGNEGTSRWSLQNQGGEEAGPAQRDLIPKQNQAKDTVHRDIALPLIQLDPPSSGTLVLCRDVP